MTEELNNEEKAKNTISPASVHPDSTSNDEERTDDIRNEQIEPVREEESKLEESENSNTSIEPNQTENSENESNDLNQEIFEKNQENNDDLLINQENIEVKEEEENSKSQPSEITISDSIAIPIDPENTELGVLSSTSTLQNPLPLDEESKNEKVHENIPAERDNVESTSSEKDQDPSTQSNVEPTLHSADSQENTINDEKLNTESSQPIEDETTTISTEDDLLDKHDDEHVEEHHEEDHHDEAIDYSTYTKKELVDLVKSVAKDDNIIKADKVLMDIKPYFEEIRNKERQQAQEKFINEGGEVEYFDFKNDELSNRFDANYRLIKDRKSNYYKEKEKQKETNLKKKQDLLERLREFVDTDETNISFDKFKAFQNEWKSIGAIPAAHNRTLWATYNALIDRFYDHRSIYYELKELDRKKNLKRKIELVEKTEALSQAKQLNVAIKALDVLHDEFKHIGPVPKDDQEPLWQRFKAASDAVYVKRKEYVSHLKVTQEENLIKKSALVEKVKNCTQFSSDRIKEWNKKTKEVVDLQKQWEAIGGMPRDKGKEVNRAFWKSFKQFFHNKGEFFKALDAERVVNLEQKKILIEKAKELKDSNDWVNTTNELISLQKQWKEIGSVPDKYRNRTYKEFKEACDYFFDHKRAQSKAKKGEYSVNLGKKIALCEQIEALANEASDDLDKLRELQAAYNDAGFVHKKDMSIVKSKYAEAVDKFINAIPNITNEDRQRIRMEDQLNKLVNDPNSDQKIYRKEQSIRKKISKIEADISLWKNNMEFFASSKNADKVRDEFNEKINVASKELDNLKNQLKVLRKF